MREQREQAGTCTVSLYQFDTEYEAVYTGVPIAEVPALDLEPRGGTAMLDAIGRTVSNTRARIAALPAQERPGAVVLGIMTDGEENSSREFTYPMVKAMVEQAEEKDGWTVLYLGSNQDAIEVGARLGVSRERSMTFDDGNAADAMASMSLSVTALRMATAEGMRPHEARRAAAFTDEQRTRSHRRE